MTTSQSLTLTINGSKLAVGTRPELSELEAALRGVALSDSPVVIRAPDDDQEHFLNRIHGLGRRRELPMHLCRDPQDARPLLDSVSEGADTTPECLGTWALWGIDAWAQEEQQRLGDVLEALDLGRLHGRLRHERIPRVVMLSQPEGGSRLLPALARRISYFTLLAEPNEPSEK